ncbi:MAG: response regulator, partial [Bacteroidota bacterium]
YVFDKTNQKVTALYNEFQEPPFYLPATDFKKIYQDENGDYWLATAKGLLHWKTATNEKRLFTRLDGLSNNNIYAVYPDTYNRLWMSSDLGIMSIDRTTLQVNSYTISDGTGQNEFNRLAHFQAVDGTIYFGGLDGITGFHPRDFTSQNEDAATLMFSELNLFDEELGNIINLLPAATSKQSITFRPSDRFLHMKFTLPTYEPSSQILYGWKMEGVYDEWTYQKENQLQFAALPYGSHQLRIKGQSAAMGWSPDELTLIIHVLKPFYLQAWFVLSAILVAIGIVASFFQYRNRLLRKEVERATITIKKQTEELRQLDKLKSRFFANVSHELRTPLSLMQGPIKRLIKTKGNGPKSGELLDFLDRNTAHLKHLVDEILDLSKLENNKLEIQEEDIPIKSFLRDHLVQFYSTGNSESVAVNSQLDFPEDLIVSLDPGKFTKILNNFISNAIKFTPEQKGRVLVSGSQYEDSLIFSVADNGPGIHPDDLPHVFDRFYQSKRSDAPTEGGTGIGLSMCKELARLLGGRVWVESIWGNGATFFLELPLKHAESTHMADIGFGGMNTDKVKTKVEEKPTQGLSIQNGNTDGEPKIVHREQQGKRILVVEDNADLRKYYKIILDDYEVAEVEHGLQALKHLETEPVPDLIISDLIMPQMDGMQLLDRLKSSDNYRHLPVIMLTAKNNRQARLKALRYGIDDYLNKPFDEEELLVRIHNLLANRAAREVQNDIDKPPVENGRAVEMMSEADQERLIELEALVASKLGEPSFGVTDIARHFAISESSLLRRLKSLTGMTPKQYLQEVRLNKARELLHKGQYKTVAEVAYKVGFRDPTSFGRSFKKRFGKVPTEVG